ncbi:hypothetical protein PSKAS_48690 [Peribacillus sp. N1]
MHIKRRFTIKPKGSNLFASYIAQRYETHKKRADQSLSGAPLVRMTPVFECKVYFVLVAYRLNKSPMNFN